jgi:hypothetical protein
VLVNLRTNRIYSLNRTGGRLWELLATGVGVQEAFAHMKEEFDVSDEMLDQEAASLIELLKREGLVEGSGER